MKLTPELIAASPSVLNCLKDRELILRGNKIPAIENLGVTKDLNDAIDLTDNDIRALAGFPLLTRLTTLSAANNLITRIDPRLAHSLPCLESLILTNNQISELGELAALGKFPNLTYVSLLGNPVTREKHYRDWIVWKCPNVRVLDFRRVKDKERQLAKSLFETDDGRPSELAVSLSYRSALKPGEPSSAATAQPRLDNTFEPGQALNGGSGGRTLTPAERKAIEEAIDRSDSLEEIRRLEERLRLGYALDNLLPPQAGAKDSTAAAAAAGAEEAEMKDAGAGDAEQVEPEETEPEAEAEADTTTGKGRKRKAAPAANGGGGKKRK
ncbi:U2 snRNP complex subunit [Tilletia horrida]|nr:U2 snRNP complex subunit [Tilletia horrida]